MIRYCVETEGNNKKKGEGNANQKYEEINLNHFFNKNQKTFINPYLSKNNPIILSAKEIQIMKGELKEKIIEEIKERKRLKKIVKIFFLLRTNKQYDENEINELDYDDAILYDKRNFFMIFWYILKQKHTIFKAFNFGDSLKPLSIKLFIIIFTLSCYLIINGLFYNDEYLTIKLTTEKKNNFFYYYEDSFDRITYTSLIGGLISFFIEIILNIQRKIENAIKHNKDNIILLRGEIVGIYKCYNILTVMFIIFLYIILAFFNIYIFCFFYVYPNNKNDWLESSLLIIGIIQSISFLNIFFISLFKYISIKYECEILFKFITYLEDNI